MGRKKEHIQTVEIGIRQNRLNIQIQERRKSRTSKILQGKTIHRRPKANPMDRENKRRIPIHNGREIQSNKRR